MAESRAGARRLIITSMKNEGPHILEWVAYHRVIGFTDFLVYTNDCEDGTDAMLDRLQAMGVLAHERNRVLRRGPQKSALKWAKDHPLAAAADWILVSDVDEFLNVKIGDGSVAALIDAVPGADAIPVTWRLFSHGGLTEFVDEPIVSQFTDAERPLEAGGFPDRFVKTIFHPGAAVERFGTHGPIAEEGALAWIQPDGRVLGFSDNLTRPASAFAYNVAQINHYAVGSVDGFLVKRDRGRVNHYRQVMGLDYWRRMCRGGEEDRTILRHLDATRAEMKRLLADDELRRLHDASVAWRRGRIAALRAIPEFEEMRTEILDLSAAGDHRRDAPSKKPAPETPRRDPKAAAKKMKALCEEMRALLPAIEPIEAAAEAEARLDEIERGLFGPGG